MWLRKLEHGFFGGEEGNLDSKKIRTPTSYGSSLADQVEKDKQNGLQSHD